MGITIAIIGASLAVALSCVGSGKGVGMVGEASSGVLAEDPSKFSACLILQIMPGTQGLYGLVIWFFAMLQLGVLGGSPMELTTAQGFAYLLACLPMALAATSPPSHRLAAPLPVSHWWQSVRKKCPRASF